MGVAERKGRERVERKQRITAAVRAIAASEGWSAGAVRRQAEAIEYSQPVLYSHFVSRDAIVAAVAVTGFSELATSLRQAARSTSDRPQARRRVAEAYLAFARDGPALYEAMFTLPSSLHFAQADTPSEPRDAFVALMEVVEVLAASASTVGHQRSERV